MEKYSVLMSVYYKEKSDFFRKSIESMLCQTVKPDEIVIVKDGKLTNELEEVLSDYVVGNENLFTIVSLAENGGLGHALNEGLKACRNELVARMDTDDISLPNRCEIQLKEFAKSGRLCICGSQIDEFVGTSENIVSSRQVPTSYDDIIKFAKRRSPFNHPTVMYKKSMIISYGGYFEYGRKEDLDLFIRVINQGAYVKNVKETLLLYRSNADNLQRRRTWQNCSEYIIVMYNFFKKGYIGMYDMLYILIGQIIMFAMPKKVVSRLSDKFLRKR